ncbi:hypothetical protein NMY22_g5185 [Coprinellus aureogranulatus]|nr:hypothetical protein NMY22_g5185 [Coprinellus aureogranulatus]
MPSSPIDSAPAQIIPDLGFSQSQENGLHVLAGAREVSIQSITSTTVGRDSHIHNVSITNNFGSTTLLGGEVVPHVERSLLVGWLKGPTFRSAYQQSLRQRMAKTGTWFLERPEFKRFVAKKGTIVWATGMPGSGKTILAAISIEYLENTVQNLHGMAIAFAFIRYTEQFTLRSILASLVTSPEFTEESFYYTPIWGAVSETL